MYEAALDPVALAGSIENANGSKQYWFGRNSCETQQVRETSSRPRSKTRSEGRKAGRASQADRHKQAQTQRHLEDGGGLPGLVTAAAYDRRPCSSPGRGPAGQEGILLLVLISERIEKFLQGHRKGVSPSGLRHTAASFIFTSMLCKGVLSFLLLCRGSLAVLVSFFVFLARRSFKPGPNLPPQYTRPHAKPCANLSYLLESFNYACFYCCSGGCGVRGGCSCCWCCQYCSSSYSLPNICLSLGLGHRSFAGHSYLILLSDEMLLLTGCILTSVRRSVLPSGMPPG